MVPRRVVRKSALKHVMNTFFDGSAEKVVAALLGPDGGRLTDEELESHRRPRREGESGGIQMSLLFDVIVRSSLVVAGRPGGGLDVEETAGRTRHWVLAATLALAAAQPVMNRIVPALQMPALNWSADANRPGPSVETDMSLEVAAASAVAVRHVARHQLDSAWC